MSNASIEDLDILSISTPPLPLQVFPSAVHSGILNREPDDYDIPSSPLDWKLSALQLRDVSAPPRLSSLIFVEKVKNNRIQTPLPVVL